MTRMEQLNTAVRPVVTLMFAATFCYLAIIRIIDAVAFCVALGTVITFWFAQRKEEKDAARADKAEEKIGVIQESVAAKAEERAVKAEEKIAAVLPPGGP